MVTTRDDRRHIYRVDNPPHKFADSILYDAGLEIPDIDVSAPGTIEYYFNSCNVTVAVDNFDAKGGCVIRAWAGDGETRIGLAFQQINLMSQRAVAGLVRELREAQPQITTWREIIVNVAWRTMQFTQASKPVLKVGTKPETMRQDFRLFPIIHEGEPTTIYCPGGVGKSYLAVYCACLVQFGYDGFTDRKDHRLWSPKQGNVLYADWEATHRDHLRRTWVVKRGLGIDHEGEFLYLPCEQPLTVLVPDMQAIVQENDIKLVIIDSQMAASDFGPDIGQNATRFYNAVRQLHCSTLILDHVSKAAMSAAADSDNSAGPHGSVVKANRSRQQYELRKHQVPGQAYIDLTMKHRKNNEGPLSEEYGIRISFVPDKETGYLDCVTFTAFDVATHPVLSATQPIWKRLWDAVEGGPLTTRELQELMADKTEDTIRATLNRHKDKFTKMEGDRWTRQPTG